MTRQGLPERIQRARLYSGRTQDQIADALGCRVQTISNWERGRTLRPNIGLLLLFAKETGSDIAWLYHGEEPNVPAKTGANPRGQGEDDNKG